MGRTMHWKPVGVSAALVMVMLAGCASESPQEEEETVEGFEDLKATKTTGVIRGIIVDSAIVPVANVTVGIKGQDRNAITNAAGAFGFADLEPGTYILEASKLGYQATQASAEVKAGEDKPPILRILMERDPSTRPFVEMAQFNGFIACSFTLFLVSFAACGVDPVAGVLGNDFINRVTYDKSPDFVQSEMLWSSTQTLGESMSMSWTDPCHGAQRRINASAGPSPQVVTWDKQLFEEMELAGCELWLRVFSTSREGTDQVDEETWNEPWRNTGYGLYNGTVPEAAKTAFNDTMHGLFGLGNNPFEDPDCIEYPVLFDACLGVGGVGATIQQDFEIFTANFYNLVPDDGWMFITDGPHPIPDS